MISRVDKLLSGKLDFENDALAITCALFPESF